MNITVKEIETSTLEMNEDWEFKCTHEFAEIEPPCCSGYDSEGLPSCGCHGQYSVYCYDCNNDDMTDNDVERIIDGSISEPEDREIGWDE